LIPPLGGTTGRGECNTQIGGQTYRSADSEGAVVLDRWETREVLVPEGAHRVASRDAPGTERDLWYRDGTNELTAKPAARRSPTPS
jgi:hypothetical protein